MKEETQTALWAEFFVEVAKLPPTEHYGRTSPESSEQFLWFLKKWKLTRIEDGPDKTQK